MTIVSSFEIIAEYLVPKLPKPLPSNPFALQGYWLQVTNVTDDDVTTSVNFFETTRFASNTYAPFAQFIDGSGNVNIVDDFLTNGFGSFSNIVIASGLTVIFGVQAFPKPPAPDAVAQASIPQAGVGWRGVVVLSVPAGSLRATATHRLAYFTDSSLSTFINGCVYPVPPPLIAADPDSP